MKQKLIQIFLVLIIAFLYGLSFTFAQSQGRNVVSQVIIKGNRKIESDAIKARIKTKEGRRYSQQSVRDDVQSIFDLGYFYNVEVDKNQTQSGVVLTYTITEKPSIVEIVYRGNNELSDSDLEESSEIKPYEILDIAVIQDAVERMQKAYEEKGYFLAKIKYRFEPIKKDETFRLLFDIEENDKVKVKSIQFIGNSKLSDSELKAKIFTKEEGFFSFLSGSGAFKQEAFARDMQILNFLYFNKGYVQVKISKPEITVSPDKKDFYITIRIQEGEQFDVGDIDFQGDLLFPRNELEESIEIKDSGTFVYETLQKDLRSLQAKYGDLGYAYANIIPRTMVREKEKKVDVVFDIDKGNKVYFGKINVAGNTKTRDKVFRRELTVFEGELYNETRKRESEANVKRLGYFESVNFNTRTPKDKPNIMDIDIVAKERNTGSVQVGAGYSSFSGAIFQGQLQQTNLFGKGQRLSVSIQHDKKNTLFNLNFTEPYFKDTLWSVGLDAYRRDSTNDEFKQTKTGGAVRVGHPLAPYLRGFIRYKYDVTDVELDSNTNPALYPVETVNGSTSSVTFTLEYDKRDDRFSPTKGLLTSTSVELAGLGGDKEYALSTATVRWFRKIFWGLVWRHNLNYGIIHSPSGNEPPFDELFRLGGTNTLRGYNFFSIGKKIMDNSVTPAREYVFGGKQQAYYNMEFEFPLISEAGIRGVIFYDIGDADDTLSLGDFRSNYGFGFRWFSPIGPLRFEWGFPIDRRAGEKPTNFQFAIGSPF